MLAPLRYLLSVALLVFLALELAMAERCERSKQIGPNPKVYYSYSVNAFPNTLCAGGVCAKITSVPQDNGE